MAKSDQPDKGEKPTPKKKRERFFAGQENIHSDLFKLEIAKVQKNIGIDSREHEPEFVGIPHMHFFHSVDSDGKPHKYAVAIAGHTHEMIEEKDPDGGPSTFTAGPALQEVRRKINGKFQKAHERIRFDDHTHVVSYVRSTNVKKREINAEATTIVTVEHQRTAPIPGVSSA